MAHAGVERRIAGIPVPPGGRALVLGDSALAPALRARGWDVLARTSPEPLDLPDAHVQLAVVAGVFGRHEWDRWLLQELERVLAPGGVLVATVPNLTSLVSPSDWAFFAGRALVAARRRAAKLAGRPAPAFGFSGRRYRIAQFLALLPPLGFADVTCDPAPAGAAPAVREYVVSARATASRFGEHPERPWPDAAAHRARYEAANPAFLAHRDAWVRAHPAIPLGAPRELDPAAFAGRDVLVLAPHPDDEVIGAGGTLSRLVAAGARVTALQATDGSEGAALRDASDADRRRIRLDEAAAVARAAGFSHVEFWREDNGHFRATDGCVTRMRELLARVRPALVFTPFVADIHPDHGTLNRILARALDDASPARVLQYEVWGLVPANTWCDVTTRGAELERLLRLYPTAMKVDDFVHFCEDRNHWHAIALAGRGGLAEAFLETSAADFRRVADEPVAGS